MSTHQLHYAGGLLDRAGDKRKDDAWLENQAERDDARLVPVWGTRSLVQHCDSDACPPEPMICRRVDLVPVLKGRPETTFLGINGDVPYFAVDITETDEHYAASALGGAFVDLRITGQHMSRDDASILAYARGMVHWNNTHQYCSRCGAVSVSKQGGHMRLCQNESCRRETYPRTDPAVIMLVEHQPDDGGSPVCLMGSHRRLPSKVFSTLAGFVEPGESLEEAVAREVREEVGIAVSDVKYHASQPWPFPASIMLGFYATATTTEITVDDVELASARWFNTDEIKSAGDWGDASALDQLPRKDSIARHIVNTWVEKQS